MNTARRPRLSMLGAMTGQIPGGLPTQGETLAGLFTQAGYRVITASGNPNRYRRLAEILWTLIRHRKESDINIFQVFSGSSFLQTDIASLLAKTLRRPIVMILRGGSLPEFSKKHRHWVQRVFTRADAIVAPSKYLARDLAGLGFPIQVIPNTIQISNYPYRERSAISPRLFWMRSFFWFYNPGMALRVLCRLLNDYPEVALEMGGPDKGLLAETKQMADTLGIAAKVKFLGFLDLPSKVSVAGQNEIYLNTNTVDNMPVSVLEMAALGLPIVATAVGGVPDLLENEKTALLVLDGDDASMAEAVKRLLCEPDLTHRLSRNGRCLAESFSAEQILPRWERLFSQLP